jgi:Tfp pilus assembly protein PilO
MEPAIKEDFYKSIPVSMTIVGDYHQTAGFFDSLQNLLRVVKVTGFKMNMRSTPAIIIDEEGKKKRESVDALQTEITADTFAYIEGSK